MLTQGIIEQGKFRTLKECFIPESRCIKFIYEALLQSAIDIGVMIFIYHRVTLRSTLCFYGLLFQSNQYADIRIYYEYHELSILSTVPIGTHRRQLNF